MKLSEMHTEDSADASPTAKPYTAPELRVFGPITNLVQNLPNVGGDAGGPVDSATS